MNDFPEHTQEFGSRAMETLLCPGSEATEKLLVHCSQRILGQEWLLECPDKVALALIQQINDLKRKVKDSSAITIIGIVSSERNIRFRVADQYRLKSRLETEICDQPDPSIYKIDFSVFFPEYLREQEQKQKQQRLDSLVEEFVSLPCRRVSIKGYEIS